jgi:D-alanyl-D-alanine carboxypeptidase
MDRIGDRARTGASFRGPKVVAVATVVAWAMACREVPSTPNHDAAGESAAASIPAPTHAPTHAMGAHSSASSAGTADASDSGASAPNRSRRILTSSCTALTDLRRHHRLSGADADSAWVTGDDLLALVNRAPTGSLAPDYVPGDLVDIRTKHPVANERHCDGNLCLRKDAAFALDELLAAMRDLGFPGHVESAYRGYRTQCATFLAWAKKSDFCRATEQSALPGHSQHQLGTTVDLFTEAWAKDERGVFRDGFGCTKAGLWLEESAWKYGFVISYPIHPDDAKRDTPCTTRTDVAVGINPMTGYRFERWHFRFIGKSNAGEFHEFMTAHAADGATLEQWLRAKKGLTGADTELPVCDGCNCGACSTLAQGDEGVCNGARVELDAEGNVRESAPPPEIVGARVEKVGAAWIVRATIRAAGNPGWEVGVGGARVPLADPKMSALYKKTNVALPARVGAFEVTIPLSGEPSDMPVVVLLHHGSEVGTRVSARLGK